MLDSTAKRAGAQTEFFPRPGAVRLKRLLGGADRDPRVGETSSPSEPNAKRQWRRHKAGAAVDVQPGLREGLDVAHGKAEPDAGDKPTIVPHRLKPRSVVEAALNGPPVYSQPTDEVGPD